MIKLKVKLLKGDNIAVELKNSNATSEEYITAIHHLILDAKKNNVSIESLTNIINKDLK